MDLTCTWSVRDVMNLTSYTPESVENVLGKPDPGKSSSGSVRGSSNLGAIT